MKARIIAVALSTAFVAPLALAENGVDYDKVRQQFQNQTALYLGATVAENEAGVDEDNTRKAFQGQRVAENEAGVDEDNTRKTFQRQRVA